LEERHNRGYVIPGFPLIRSVDKWDFMPIRGGRSHFPHLRCCVSHAPHVFQCLKNTAGESLGETLGASLRGLGKPCNSSLV